MTSEHLDKIEQEAWQSWEDDQKTNPKRVNPHAYTYGYKAGRLKSDEDKNTRIKELENGLREIKKEFGLFDELEDPSVGDLMTFVHRLKQLLNKK